MLKQYLPLLAAITIFCGCRRVQHSDQYVEISILTPTGWWLHIKPDGSGEYGYGSSIALSHFASGTFRFDEIFNKLSSKTFENGNIREHYGVTFPRKDITSTVAVYTKDKDLVRKIFELAHENRGRPYLTQTDVVKVKPGQNDYVNKLWSERPPFPN